MNVQRGTPERAVLLALRNGSLHDGALRLALGAKYDAGAIRRLTRDVLIVRGGPPLRYEITDAGRAAIDLPPAPEPPALQEVRNLLGSAQADLITRRDHPSYGVTKASVRDKLTLAEGMLRMLAFQDGRLRMLTVSTAALERTGDDPLYELAQTIKNLTHDLKSE